MEFSKIHYAVLGGDARQSYLYRLLRKKGWKVHSFGLPGSKEDFALLDEILAGADCLLLPLPITRDGVRLFWEREDEAKAIRLDFLAKSGKKVLFGGKIPEWFRLAAEECGTKVFDYFDSESLQILNALPTAEGAISVAMQELPVTIFGSTVAVIGYGRIGRLLSERLTALGANVIVYERKEERHPLIRFSSATPRSFSDESGKNLLCFLPKDCKVVFNTVPERIFTGEALERFPKNCLFVDLASPPGGIDLSGAADLGIRRIWATALPGKYAPESAASYLAEEMESTLARSFL